MSQYGYYFKFRAKVIWYLRAVMENPGGILCAICHRPNFNYDDVGWWGSKQGVECGRHGFVYNGDR